MPPPFAPLQLCADLEPKNSPHLLPLAQSRLQAQNSCKRPKNSTSSIPEQSKHCLQPQNFVQDSALHSTSPICVTGISCTWIVEDYPTLAARGLLKTDIPDTPTG